MQVAHARQQPRSGVAGGAQQPLVGEHERDLVARIAHLSQPRLGSLGRQLAVDPVVGGVAAPQLAGDPLQRAGIVVHGQQDGQVVPTAFRLRGLVRLLLSREIQSAVPSDRADHTRGPVLGCAPPDVHRLAAQTLSTPADRTGCDRRRGDRRADRRPDRGTSGPEVKDKIEVGSAPSARRGRARRGLGPEQRRRDADQGRPGLEEDRQPAGAGRRGARSSSRWARDRCGPPAASAAAWSAWTRARSGSRRPSSTGSSRPASRSARAPCGSRTRGGHRDPDRPPHEPQGRKADQGRARARRASSPAAAPSGLRTSAATPSRASIRAPTASSRPFGPATGRRTWRSGRAASGS